MFSLKLVVLVTQSKQTLFQFRTYFLAIYEGILIKANIIDSFFVFICNILSNSGKYRLENDISVTPYIEQLCGDDVRGYDRMHWGEDVRRI